MTIQQYIKLNFDGRQDKYAAAMGFHAKQVSRFMDRRLKRETEVDGNGWPYIAFKQRKG